jgi:nucleotide-binding universal stress UspA family protein
MLKHILVGVDGSEGSRKALAFAVGLARNLGARLTLMAVLEPPIVLPFGPMESFAVVPTISDQHLEALRKMLRECAAAHLGVPMDEVVEVGRAAETITDQADKRNADLIVMGAHGHNPAKRLLIGSVSDRVVHISRRPVTVVH